MKFIILGTPFSKQSFRFTKSGHKYQKKEVVEKQEAIQWQVVNQLPDGFKPFTGGVRVTRLLYVFPPLKSFSKKQLILLKNGVRIYKTTKPDLTDNLNKGLFDAMQGLVYINDSQVCEVENMVKCYGLQPRIEIELEEIE